MNLVDVVEVALRVIQDRLILILCMVATWGLFAWAMWLQTVLGAIIAATWGLTIFLPVLFRGRGVSDGLPEAPNHDQPQAPGG